jgi:deoxyribodipyrimidine photo-lyase
VGYAKSLDQSRVISVFCLDPNLLQKDDMAPVRVVYLLDCLKSLQKEYQEAGLKLLILHQDPVIAIVDLATRLGVQSVCWNLDVEPYAISRDQIIKDQLVDRGILVNTHWDQLLHFPGEILTGTNQPYTVYTPFWKNWISKPKAQPIVPKLTTLNLSTEEEEILQGFPSIPVPTAAELGFTWDKPIIFHGGTQGARERLAEFCDRSILNYEIDRNYPAIDGTSGLSAALNFGVIGIREVWQMTENILEYLRGEEAKRSVEVWRQELAWREFYQHCLYYFPSLAEGAYREPFKYFPWVNNPDHFAAWCEGETGYPIVDAAMRQLNETGWMHNRCRMIVASFLTKDLIIDWRWGEKYFMQHLIDGDLAANNGGWQWSASSGMDPKPLRIFNPTTQMQKFDPEGEYICNWVEELRSIDRDILLSGKIPPLVRKGYGYPLAIVDHQIQQRNFKARYAQIKIS